MPTVTAVKVIDCSAVAAVLFGEPEAKAVTVEIGDAQLTAPRLLAFEIANTCLVKCRRHPAQRGALLAAHRLYAPLHIEEAAVDQAEVLDLALETGLTAYDASYLWLTRHLGAELVTLDRQLKRAAITP